MGKLRDVLVSVKRLGVLAALSALCGTLLALLGFDGLAIAFSSSGLGFLAAMLFAADRNRRVDQKKVLASIGAISSELVKQNGAHRAHTKSLGLVFRQLKLVEGELRAVERAVAGEDSLLTVRTEQQLATYLLAIRASSNVLLEAIRDENRERTGGEGK